MNFIKKNSWFIFVLFYVNSSWTQQNDKQIEVIVYRPRVFSQVLVKTRVFGGDSLVARIPNGKYKKIKLKNSDKKIEIKYGGRKDSVDLSKVNSNCVFLRVCWEYRFIKLNMSLVPVHEFYAIEEIKELEPM